MLDEAVLELVLVVADEEVLVVDWEVVVLVDAGENSKMWEVCE